MAAGVPMTVLATAAAAAAEGASRERGSLAAEQPPAAATLRPQTMETLTEEEKAGLSLLGLRGSGSRTETNPMDGIGGLASEAIENAAHRDHGMSDTEEMGKAAVDQPRYSGMSTIPSGKVQVTTCNDHAVRGVREMSNVDVEQPRDSGRSTTPSVKVRAIADNDHVMLDAQETRKPLLEQPWDSSLSIAIPVKVRVTETKYRPNSILKDVRGLLSTGLLEGFRVTYKKNEVERIGRIIGQGYSCGCSECGYRNIMNACEFEQHSGESSNNQNNHIFLDSGISLYMVIQELKYTKLCKLGDVIKKEIGLPPNMVQYERWKASFQLEMDDFHAAPSDPCSTQGLQKSNTALMVSLKESTSDASSILNWSSFRRRSDRQFKRRTEAPTPTFSRSPDKETSGLSTGTSMKSGSEETPSENTADPVNADGINHISKGPVALKSTSSEHDPINMALPLSSLVTVIQDSLRDHDVDSNSKDSEQPKVRENSLHPMLFKKGGLRDYTLLTYKLKNGKALKQGYKLGASIVCDCCHVEFTPSHFEDHAGMGRRRQPYHSIYTSDGLTLHELALKLQDGLNSNAITSTFFP